MSRRVLARALNRADIGLIADYWSNANSAYLRRMGADISKVPSRDDWLKLLSTQLDLPLEERTYFYTIWEIDDQPIGHCNVNKIRFGVDAYMHLHIWRPDGRRKGFGSVLVRQSLAHFFAALELEDLYCEPYALNSAPNKTLARVGFDFVERYRTVPGHWNFEQYVNRWHMSRRKFQSLMEA